MKRWLIAAAFAALAAGLCLWPGAADPQLPAQVDGYLLAPVDEALAQRIADAQDGKGAAFTIAVDGGKPEPLTVAPERLRDYQNVYFRIVGGPGALRLEETGFSPAGADRESRLIRRALGVGEERDLFFLPGRQHLLIPAKAQAVLAAAGQVWTFRAAGAGAVLQPTRAVVVRPDQVIVLALAEDLSSAKVRAGEAVALTVAADVKADGLIAIAKGAGAEARVRSVQRPSFPGNPGRIVLELGSVVAADGTRVPLSGNQGAQMVFVGRRSSLVSSGRHVELTSGTRIRVRAAQPTVVLAPR